LRPRPGNSTASAYSAVFTLKAMKAMGMIVKMSRKAGSLLRMRRS
jgi:hypothetical protein